MFLPLWNWFRHLLWQTALEQDAEHFITHSSHVRASAECLKCFEQSCSTRKRIQAVQLIKFRLSVVIGLLNKALKSFAQFNLCCICRSIMLLCCVTIVVVSQLHVEADAVRQRTQVLHQSVELPHQQDAGLLGVATWHRQLVVVDADEKLK